MSVKEAVLREREERATRREESVARREEAVAKREEEVGKARQALEAEARKLQQERQAFHATMPRSSGGEVQRADQPLGWRGESTRASLYHCIERMHRGSAGADDGTQGTRPMRPAVGPINTHNSARDTGTPSPSLPREAGQGCTTTAWEAAPGSGTKIGRAHV